MTGVDHISVTVPMKLDLAQILYIKASTSLLFNVLLVAEEGLEPPTPGL